MNKTTLNYLQLGEDCYIRKIFALNYNNLQSLSYQYFQE